MSNGADQDATRSNRKQHPAGVELARVFDGWNGYQASLLHAVTPLTPRQLSWRPVTGRRSAGELIRHLVLGRITWFSRMGAPGVETTADRVPGWYTDDDGSRHAAEDSLSCNDATLLVEWLGLSWHPIQRVLDEWTVDDLFETYPHRLRGIDYRVSRQWTIWRIMSHDVHHGGQLAMMLALQGIDAFELRALGGHIIRPQVASPADHDRGND